ncbi:MAG TPA: hypothetical protein VMB34_12790 [Acetobacteraceae bacterium]|nr:hypothetical protein [Acetobacteraceae bacterium]
MAARNESDAMALTVGSAAATHPDTVVAMPAESTHVVGAAAEPAVFAAPPFMLEPVQLAPGAPVSFASAWFHAAETPTAAAEIRMLPAEAIPAATISLPQMDAVMAPAAPDQSLDANVATWADRSSIEGTTVLAAGHAIVVLSNVGEAAGDA